MSTCLWYDEDFEADRAHQAIASSCTKEATHYSCCWAGDASKANVCEEHKCRCAAKMAPAVEATPMPGKAGSCASCGRRIHTCLVVDFCSPECRETFLAAAAHNRAGHSSGETRSDAEKALSDLVDLVEMDEEASQVGSPLWLAVTTAKEILARRSSRFTVLKCPACFADKPCPSHACEHPDRALPFTGSRQGG